MSESENRVFYYTAPQKLEVVKVYPMDPRVAREVLDMYFSIQFLRWGFSFNVNNMLNHMHTQIERTVMPLRNYMATFRMKLYVPIIIIHNHYY